MEKITNENPLSHSEDLVANNIEKLKTLFPEIVTEGKIDFKVLQSILGEEIEEGEEYYRFTWAGKVQARREAHKPSTGTLRPCKEDSVDWDNTQNLYIEGDNLEVLKLLQKSYAGKVKMIYIDPPYNTGNDFVYKDDYKDNLKNYQEITGQIDDNGNKITTNSDSEGRYHSNWLNMMYPRLLLARNMLTSDGVVFISIGPDELSNLISISDSVFGEMNQISILVRQAKTGGNTGKYFSPNVEYILVYAKAIDFVKPFKTKMSEELITKVYNQVEEEGERKGEKYRTMGLYQASLKDLRPNQKYFIECPDGTLVLPPCEIQDEVMRPGDGRWRWTKEKFLKEAEAGNVLFKKSKNQVLVDSKGQPSDWNIYTKIWLKDREEEGQVPNDLILKYENRHSAKELSSLNIPFDFAKPVGLLKYLIDITQLKNDVVLDFFSGSASTAHAVMEINAEDGGNRKYIQVQLPEPTDEKSEAFKAGYKKITEIGKERIRRAGKKIAEENPEKAKDLDLGFKVFKLDSSNIRSWDGNLEGKELDAVLKGFIDNTKDSETTVNENGELIPNPDVRTQEDILYEILLKYGLDLTLPIEEKEIAGKKVFNVGFGALFICLGNNITSAVAEGIGQWKEEVNPEVCRVVFKDNGFTDVEKTNSVQILKRFGITEIKTL